MSEQLPTPVQVWNFDPVRVWLLPHVPGTRGEPQARELLAAELGGTPQTLPLTRDERSRPWLIGELAHYGTGWSHSGGQLLVGLGENVRLGVDLEQLRPRKQMREVIRRFFHPEEIAWFADLDEADCQQWFFRVWCAKEAVLKAHGHGISYGLHNLRFAPDAAGALQLVWCDSGLGDAQRWQLREWQATADFRAALAWYPL